MTSYDFGKLSMLHEAQRLRVQALRVLRGGCDLEESSAIWLVRDDMWRDFLLEAEIHMLHDVLGHYGMPRLLRLPIRRTIGDAPDTPRIQLVMEPRMAPQVERVK